MEKLKVKAAGSNILQIAEGTEYDAIKDGDDLYIKFLTMPNGASNGSSNGKKSKPAAEAEPEDKPKRGAKSNKEDDVWEKVEAHLKGMDEGKLNRAKTIASITEDAPDIDEALVKQVVTKMDKDSNFSVEEALEELKGEGAEEEKSGPRRRKAKAEDEDEDIEGQPKGEVVKDWSDLTVGDRVSVYWSGKDYEDWFEGEVEAKLRGGKVTIAYDDDTKEALDEKMHTRVVRIKAAK